MSPTCWQEPEIRNYLNSTTISTSFFRSTALNIERADMSGILTPLLMQVALVSSFSYDDTDTWCSSENWYCCPEFTTQSPININTVNGLNHDCPINIDGGLDWVLGTTTSYTIENTGHSLKVIPSGSNLGTLVIDDKQYCLASWHVHWGEEDLTGSEHTMNGVHASLEI
eukprot:194068_1